MTLERGKKVQHVASNLDKGDKGQKQRSNNYHSKHNAIRDHRSYSEALMGKQSESQLVKNRRDAVINKQVNGQKIIKLPESKRTERRLKLASVLDCEGFESIEQAGLAIEKIDVPYECMSSLSPSKLIVFFDNETYLESALDKSSPLNTMLTDVRRWSNGENYLERTTWLECVGLNPSCYSYENFILIGDNWGKTLKVDNVFDGVNSLTSVKLMVRTNVPHKIEEKVRIEWSNGSCDIWVREISKCGCKCMGVTDQLELNHNEPLKSKMVNEEMESLRSKEPTGKGDNQLAISPTVDINDEVENNHMEQEDMVIENEVGHGQNGEHNLLINDDRIVIDGTLGLRGEMVRTNGIVVEYASCEGRNQDHYDQGATFDGGAQKKNQTGIEYEILADDATNLSENGNRFSEHASNLDDSFVDLVSRNLGDHASLPTEVDAFDPMVEVGFNIGSCVHSLNDLSTTRRKQRGRSKRVISSLPNPLYVPTTPSSSMTEAQATWKTANSVGVRARNEEHIVAELRKSKRILAMVEKNPVVG